MNKRIDFVLVRRLRKAFNLWGEYNAQQVLDITKGTTTRAFIELEMAAEQMSRAFRKAFRHEALRTRNIVERMKQEIERVVRR